MRLKVLLQMELLSAFFLAPCCGWIIWFVVAYKRQEYASAEMTNHAAEQIVKEKEFCLYASLYVDDLHRTH